MRKGRPGDTVKENVRLGYTFKKMLGQGTLLRKC